MPFRFWRTSDHEKTAIINAGLIGLFLFSTLVTNADDGRFSVQSHLLAGVAKVDVTPNKIDRVMLALVGRRGCQA